MKMLCIKDGQWKTIDDHRPYNGPKYMETVTKVADCDEEFIVLAEYPYPDVYRRIYFIPLSDIDETEMVREKDLVNV